MKNLAQSLLLFEVALFFSAITNPVWGQSYEGSYIGEAVYSTVSDSTKYNQFSTLTTRNETMSDWLWMIGDVNEAPSPARAQACYMEIADMLRRTSFTFEMSTLFYIKNSGLELLKEHIAPAIRELHDNNVDNTGPKPYLRFLQSMPFFRGSSAKKVYEALTSKLPEDASTWNVNIKVGNFTDVVGWNHSKIAVRDRTEAIAGGMNWSKNYLQHPTDNANAYLTDINMQIHGEAAAAASDFIVKVFNKNVTNFRPPNNFGAKRRYDDPEYTKPEPNVSNRLNVFSLGRGLVKRNFFSYNFDQSADRAIFAAIDAASESIYMVQPSYKQFVYITQLMDKLMAAVLRGVEVKLVVDADKRWQGVDIYGFLEEMMDEQGLAEDIRDLYRNKLQVAAYRAKASSEHPLKAFDVHHKFIMFDRRAFYISSQNMYPSAIQNVPIYRPVSLELNEFGFLVDDETLTTEVLNAFWKTVWSESELVAMANPNGIIGSEKMTLNLPNGATRLGEDEKSYETGDIWYTGTIRPVQWQTTSSNEPVNVYLHRRSAQPRLNMGISNLPHLGVSVPSELELDDTTFTTNGTYRLKVSRTHDSNIYDVSDGDIFVSAPPEGNVVLQTPLGGEVYQQGDSLGVSWSNISDEVHKVIKLYKGGEVYAVLGEGAYSSPFTWFIPDTLQSGDDYWVEISDNATNPLFKLTNYDTSDDFFTIQQGDTSEISTLWLAEYDSTTGDKDEKGEDMVVDRLGNTYILGWTDDENTGDRRLLLMKYNTHGTLMWVEEQGANLLGFYGYHITLDRQDNPVLLGMRRPSSHNSPTLIMKKYNPGGQELWSYAHEAERAYARDLACDQDGNLFFVGEKVAGNRSSILLIKMTGDGIVDWVKDYNDNSIYEKQTPVGVRVDAEGNCYVAGTSSLQQSSDFVLLKYAPDGSLSWVRNYDAEGSYDRPHGIALEDNGTVYLTGKIRSADGTDYYTTLAYNSSGDQLWVHRPGTFSGTAYDIKVDNQGSVYITGNAWQNDQNKLITMKYAAATGAVLWLNEEPFNYVYGVSLALDGSGNCYVLAVKSPNQVALYAYSRDGASYWENTFGQRITEVIGIQALDISSQNKHLYVVAVSDHIYVEGYNTLAYKFDIQLPAGKVKGYNWVGKSDESIEADNTNYISNELVSDERNILCNYPSVFRDLTHFQYELKEADFVRLAIYNGEGRLVKTMTDEFQSGGMHHITWDGYDNQGKALPKGVYIFRLDATGKSEHGKVVLLR